MRSQLKTASDLSVAIVSGSISRAAGGILPIMQAHARELSKANVSVKVLGIADEFSDQDILNWSPLSPEYFSPLFRGFEYAPALSRTLIASSSVDVVHQHGIWHYPSVATSRWRRRYKRPVIISTQGMLEPWALANSKMRKIVAGKLFEMGNLKGASCLHCSQAEVEGIRQFGLKNPIAVLPNGVDLPISTSKLPRPAWLPNDDRRTLLFLGRLHPKKGIRETLEAWAKLKSFGGNVGREWRLVIAGWDEGGYENYLISHAKNLGLTDDVVFPGPLLGEQKQSVYQHSNAFILASHSEGLPMAVLEAWSHSLPVFMTFECNLAEGFTASAGIEITNKPRELANTLSNSLVSPELTRMGERGRQLVERRFNWQHVGNQLIGVYLWLKHGDSRPSCIELN
jgi:poly(glycerol-phosphate) alpha-glucosyltransferase